MSMLLVLSLTDTEIETMKPASKAERQIASQKVAAGILKHIKKNQNVNGEELSPKELIAVFSDVVDTGREADGNRAQYHASIRKQQSAEARAKVVVTSLKATIIAQYGPNSPILADFGFEPKKATAKTVESKMQAVEKLRATRAARHTMGSRQREAIHGDVNAASNSDTSSAQAPATNGAAPTNGAATNGSSATSTFSLVKPTG